MNSYRKLRHTIACLLVIWTCAQTALAQDAETPARKDTLDKFLNMDAKDTATKLAVIQHEVYQLELTNVLIRFDQMYGNRIAMEPVSFASGLDLIPGYVFRAKNLDRSKKHPAMVIVHGGFHDRFDTYFFEWIDALTAKGYVVMFPDYRGSSGYGEPHYRNSYGNTDVTDVLAGADFVSKLDDVDANRLGIVGHSRGGMVTLLAIERAPKKFKAAVEIAGLVDFLAYMSYKPEYRRQEVANEAQFNGQLPNENLAAYMKVSPINFVQDIQTPLLVLANTYDGTVPLALHSGRLIDLLKAKGKVYDAHVYTNAPGGHMFPFGNTDEARDVQRRIVEWADKYLMH